MQIRCCSFLAAGTEAGGWVGSSVLQAQGEINTLLGQSFLQEDGTAGSRLPGPR